VYIIAIINYVLISFSVVQIYDIHIFIGKNCSIIKTPVYGG